MRKSRSGHPPSPPQVEASRSRCPLATFWISDRQASPVSVSADLGVGGRCSAAGPSLTFSSLLPAGWPGPTPSVSELERRRLEEALEAAQGEARGAQLREEQLQAECERLQGELKQLQESRAQVKGRGTGAQDPSQTSPQVRELLEIFFRGPGLPPWVAWLWEWYRGESGQGDTGV